MDAVLRVSDAVKAFRVCRFPVLPGTLDIFCLNQETRLSAIRPPSEFFDYHRISRPADLNQATSVCSFAPHLASLQFNVLMSRESHTTHDTSQVCTARNIRMRKSSLYMTGNYGLIIAVLAVYALISNPLLLIALGFLVGGFAVINKWGATILLLLFSFD